MGWLINPPKACLLDNLGNKIVVLFNDILINIKGGPVWLIEEFYYQ